MRNKLLAVTVGVGGQSGPPVQPIIESIGQENPSHALFFVTGESLEKTMPALEQHLRDAGVAREDVMLPDGDDFTSCLGVMEPAIASAAERLGIGHDHVRIDYTTGTKAMTAAIVLAGVRLRAGAMNYVSGRRGRDGRTITGTGRVFSYRPVDIYWDEDFAYAVRLFNAGRFTACIAMLEDIADLIYDERRDRARALRTLAEAHLLWDHFNIKGAHEMLKGLVRDSRDRLDELGCAEKAEDALALLGRMVNGRTFDSRATKYKNDTMLDLLMNAARRIDEGRYDDAVARLYRLMEFIAQARLYNEYGIDTGEVYPDQVPGSPLRERLFVHGRETAQVSLRAAYELLELKGDAWGTRFREMWEEFQGVLAMRNGSILAHGFDPVGEDGARKMYGLAREFLLGCLGPKAGDGSRSVFMNVSVPKKQGGVP